MYMFICHVIFVFNNINVCTIIPSLYLIIGIMCLLGALVTFVNIDPRNAGVSLGCVLDGFLVPKLPIRKIE